MASTVRSHRRAHAVRSRRRVTAIGVPSAVVALIGVAFAAAPAIASNNTALPFPTVCASGQSSSSSASASASSSSATPSTTATGTPSPSTTSTASPSASTTAKAQGAQTGSSPSASGTGTSAATGGSSASPSAGSSGSGDGVWGWLNGVWTWIFSDAQYVGQSGAVAAAAPLTHGGAHFEDVADTTGTASTSSASSTSSSDSNCISSASAAALKAKAEAGGTSEGVYAGTTPWVMKTSSMLMYDLTYNGVKTVKVWNAGAYEDEQVLDFTASKLTITSMVTYSIQNGQTVYNNAGSGTTTTLIDPHLMVVSMTAQLLGLVPQTYTPSQQPPLPVGLTVSLIPVLFTDVTTQLAYLHTGTISVPGFDGFGVDGTAVSPQ